MKCVELWTAQCTLLMLLFSRCLEPGQKFRIFNSDHFTFLKNFNPTSGSRVSIFGQKYQIAPKNSSSGRSGNGLDGLETVWCVWNHARSFGNSILIIFLFLKISIGRLLPELVFRGWKSGLDGLETVWGVWNQAKISGNSILNIFLFWKMSIRRLVPELVSNRTKKHLMKGGGPFSYCKKIPTNFCFHWALSQICCITWSGASSFLSISSNSCKVDL